LNSGLALKGTTSRRFPLYEKPAAMTEDTTNHNKTVGQVGFFQTLFFKITPPAPGVKAIVKNGFFICLFGLI
jgi:hypothetical protein